LEEASLQGSGFVVGNPNLTAEKTTQYEVAIRRSFGEHVVADFTVYYKDIQDLVSFYQIASEPNSLLLFNNADAGSIKGFATTVEIRRTGKFQGRVTYTYQQANGSGSASTFGFRSSLPIEASKTQIYAPLAFDQRHTMQFQADVRNGKNDGPVIGGMHPLQNAGVNMLLNIGSGLPYTATTIAPANLYTSIGGAQTLGRKNSLRMPWTWRFDIRADKTFYRSSSISINVYVQILNLFDRKNVINVFGGTGEGDNSGIFGSQYWQRLDEPGRQRRGPQYDVYHHNGFNYAAPRQVRLGVVLNF
jgi:outer membrane receptor protein involved in Fe transport